MLLSGNSNQVDDVASTGGVSHGTDTTLQAIPYNYIMKILGGVSVPTSSNISSDIDRLVDRLEGQEKYKVSLRPPCTSMKCINLYSEHPPVSNCKQEHINIW
jgi:hypothetical protein